MVGFRERSWSTTSQQLDVLYQGPVWTRFGFLNIAETSFVFEIPHEHRIDILEIDQEMLMETHHSYRLLHSSLSRALTCIKWKPAPSSRSSVQSS